MRLIKQNDTSKVLLFVMYDSTDHVTPKTGLTPTVQISKNGAAFAAGGGTVAELGSGWYKYTFAATDVDTLGPLGIEITATGADPVKLVYTVVAYDPYNAASLGLSNLDVAVSTRSSHAAADVWAVATRTVTGGTIDTVNNPVSIDMSQALPATPTAGTTGSALKKADTNLDAAVSTRSSHTASDVWAVATRTITGGTVDTVVNDVNINMGQALPATPTADTVGAALKDADTQLDVAVSSRATDASVWSYATRSLTSPVQLDMSQPLPAAPTAGTTGKALANAESLAYRTGSVNDTSPTATSFITDLPETTTGHWNSMLIVFTSGPNAGVGRRISAYDGSTKQVTLEDALPAAPANGDRFVIYAIEVQPEAGGGTGVADWTDAEKAQIRYRLGIDGTASAPTATPDLARPVDVWQYTTRTLTGPVQIDMAQTLPGTPTAGTTGSALKNADTYLDVAISTRSSHSAADVWSVATRTITGGTVDSVAQPVTIDMNQALPATPTADTTGEALKNASGKLDVAVSTRSAFNPATDTVIVGQNQDKSGYTLDVNERDLIADAVLRRPVQGVEATAPEHSLCTVVLAMLESERGAGQWTIYKSDGQTVHVTKNISTDPNAQPVVRVD